MKRTTDRIPSISCMVAVAVTLSVHAGAAPRQALWVYPDQSSSSGIGAPNSITDPGARALLVHNSAASDVTDLYVSVYQSTANAAGRQMYPDADIADVEAAATVTPVESSMTWA